MMWNKIKCSTLRFIFLGAIPAVIQTAIKANCLLGHHSWYYTDEVAYRKVGRCIVYPRHAMSKVECPHCKTTKWVEHDRSPQC